MADAPDVRKLARILVKAVHSLPAKEQGDVLRTLLETALTVRAAGGGSADPALASHPFAAMPPDTPRGQLHGLMTPEASVTFGAARGGEHRMVPIRLPESLHARLKGWSTEHGFAMAVVIRGLVERFLDQQQAPAA